MAERTPAHPKIKPIWDSVVTEVLDSKQDKVIAVRLKNVRTNAESTVDCAGVFVRQSGHVPNTASFSRALLTWTMTNGYIERERKARKRICRARLWPAIVSDHTIARR